MAEAEAREKFKLKPIWCLWWPEIFIPISYIAPNNPPVIFCGSRIPILWFTYSNFYDDQNFTILFLRLSHLLITLALRGGKQITNIG